MAHIDIQEKRGASWIWWVLGLVVLAALLWWYFGTNNRSTVVSDGSLAPNDTVATGMATTGSMAMNGSNTTVDDLYSLAAATSAADFTGRPVALRDVPVSSVVSNKAFWAGTSTSATDGVLIVRGNQMESYTAPNGAVNAGTRVNIYGVVRDMPTDLTQSATEWNLGSTDQQRIGARPLYVYADSVRMGTP